ncbi:MAG TPA: murein biosynthesis integral membrane protein MurJ [Mycobacteriales bacterium]|nr:murein biosynthesis integral membrane protein MurJ [Mycobacteriales bacterium]
MSEDGGGRSLARSGLAMATGTAMSRFTGFVRTLVIAYAIGLGGVGNAYAYGNTVPNILYDLLLGGILSSVVVPLLVRASRDDEDAGEAYAQRLVTIVSCVLLVAAIAAVLLAPLIVRIYADQLHPAQRELATTFARYFLPQLLFYGLGAIFGAILNVRGSFAPPMWAPVLNNLVVIAAGLTFYAVTHSAPHAGHLTTTQTLLLGIGTTAGVIAQTVALLPALRHVGFRLRARWDWRGAGLRRAGGFAGWMLGYVVTNQLAYVVVAELAGAISGGKGAYAVYSSAFVLFSLPYAIVAVTVITALFPGMSRSAAEGDEPAVASTLATGLSVAGVVMVPMTFLLIVLGPALCVLVFAHGHTTIAAAHQTGRALAGFAIGLVPFSAFQMQLRAWLAVHDSRTPMLVNLGATAVNVLLDLVLYVVLPDHDRVVGLAVGYSVSYAVGTLIFIGKLRRRLPSARRTYVIRTHVRLAVAAVIAAVPAELLTRWLTDSLGQRPLGALATIVVAGGVGLSVFALLISRMRVAEIRMLLSMLPGRRATAG